MKAVQAPDQEQAICVTCGFCCDGTLFSHASLREGERGRLPDKIVQACFSEGGKDYFRLPCGYFTSKCSIYDRKRAEVCGTYRCQLLVDFAAGKVSLDDALATVREAIEMRKLVMDEFRRSFRDGGETHFRQVLVSLGKICKLPDDGSQLSGEQELLIARCNIFEALLIRHFRSEEAFEKMVMK